MRALQFSEYGGPDVVSVAEVPDPHAGAAEVRIQVRATSLNAVDAKIRSGAMSRGEPLDGPQILGFDAAGVVDEVGSDVSGIAVGDEVLGLGQHTHAEYAVLRSWARKPASVDWAVAASVGVAGETAERGLRLLGVGQGSTVFIDGGAGGVGAVAVQLAQALGATVIASASEADQDYLREIRALPVRYGAGVADRVRAAARHDHVDAVFDTAGKTPIEDLVALVREPSQVVSIANFNAATTGARVTGGGSDSRPFDAKQLAADLLADNRLVVKMETFPFGRAAEAYQRLEGRGRGKVVLLP